MKAALVEVDTGRIVQTMELPNLTHAPTGDGLAAYECGEQVTDATHYRTHSGFAQMQARPSSHHVFNYQTKQWEDPRTLEDFKANARQRIEAWRDKEENQTFQFTHAGRQWDAGIITRQRMQPVLGLSQLPEGFFWTDAANVDVPITMASLQALAQAHEEALVIKGFEIHAQQRAMKNAVAAATTKEQVQSIVIGYSSQ